VAGAAVTGEQVVSQSSVEGAQVSAPPLREVVVLVAGERLAPPRPGPPAYSSIEIESPSAT
jgi:hypothetical protein